MSNPIPVSKYAPSDLTRKVVLTYLQKQPWYIKRKDLIALVAGAIITIAQLGLVPTDAPTWVNAVIGALTWVAALFVISGTPGAITPSMESRLASVAEELDSDEYVGEHRAES